MKKILIILTFAGLMTACSLTGNKTIPVIDQTSPQAIQAPEATPTTVPSKEVPVVTAPIQTPTPKPKPIPVPVPVPTPTPKPSGYTLSDVQKHNTSGDCWMILSGGVYNVTSYISQHPGGNQITR